MAQGGSALLFLLVAMADMAAAEVALVVFSDSLSGA